MVTVADSHVPETVEITVLPGPAEVIVTVADSHVPDTVDTTVAPGPVTVGPGTEIVEPGSVTVDGEQLPIGDTGAHDETIEVTGGRVMVDGRQTEQLSEGQLP